MKHVRARRSGKVHYRAERQERPGLLCWSPGGGFYTREVDDTDDPVDCKLCLAKRAVIDRRPSKVD